MTYRILLVEDSKIMQKIGRMILESLDCEIDFATTGKEAVIYASSKPYDLIFMDIGLPDMDGLTVTEAIRESDHSNSLIPIIALTVHSEDQLKAKAEAVGMSDFVVKPLTMGIAKKIIRNFCQTKNTVDS